MTQQHEIQAAPACLCKHPLFEHQGELAPQCEAERCECLQYRPVEIPGHELNGKARFVSLEAILQAGKKSAYKRTVALTEKIAVEINDLRGRLMDEREAVQAEKVAELARLVLAQELATAEAAVAELRAKMKQTHKPKGDPKPEERTPKPRTIPCGIGDCPEMFESGQQAGGHRRWHHRDLPVAS